MESPDSSPEHVSFAEVAHGANLGRVSKRNQQEKMKKMCEKAAELTRKRNLEGTIPSPSCANSFSALSNLEIVDRASKMGVQIPLNDFRKIDILREMEVARSSLSQINNAKDGNNLIVQDGSGRVIPLCLSWIDHEEIEEKVFTPVKSRKKKNKSPNRNVLVSPLISSGRPLTRGQKAQTSSALPPSRTGRLRQKPDRYK